MQEEKVDTNTDNVHTCAYTTQQQTCQTHGQLEAWEYKIWMGDLPAAMLDRKNHNH